MHDWNVIVTSASDGGRALLPALKRLGKFRRSGFKGVFLGHVLEVDQFLEEINWAHKQDQEWFKDIARVLPLEHTFEFTPENFEEQVRRIVDGFPERMSSGTFYVRLERRGFKGQIISPEVERRLDDYLIDLANRQGMTLQVSFHDPDYTVVAETIRNFCGVALIPREIRRRYPFVKVP